VLVQLHLNVTMRERDIAKGTASLPLMMRAGLISTGRRLAEEGDVPVYHLTQYGRLRLDADQARYGRAGEAQPLAPKDDLRGKALAEERSSPLPADAFGVLSLVSYAGRFKLASTDFHPHLKTVIFSLAVSGFIGPTSDSLPERLAITERGKARMYAVIDIRRIPAPTFDSMLVPEVVARMRALPPITGNLSDVLVKPAQDWLDKPKHANFRRYLADQSGAHACTYGVDHYFWPVESFADPSLHPLHGEPESVWEQVQGSRRPAHSHGVDPNGGHSQTLYTGEHSHFAGVADGGHSQSLHTGEHSYFRGVTGPGRAHHLHVSSEGQHTHGVSGPRDYMKPGATYVRGDQVYCAETHQSIGPTGNRGPVCDPGLPTHNPAPTAENAPLRVRLYPDGAMVIDNPQLPLKVMPVPYSDTDKTPPVTMTLDAALRKNLSLFVKTIAKE
jgi:hypothetical protein